jgi:hypothetical protein
MKGIIAVASLALAAGCAGDPSRLVAGQSTVADVEKAMGRAADQRPAPGGETVYYYPQLPWGYATYAARIAPDGKLVAIEQRLTANNVEQLKAGATREADVYALLGPPYEPMTDHGGRAIWTYPMRLDGDPTPKWLLVNFTADGVVREKHYIDDPNYNQPDGLRRR